MTPLRDQVLYKSLHSTRWPFYDSIIGKDFYNWVCLEVDLRKAYKCKEIDFGEGKTKFKTDLMKNVKELVSSND